MSYEECEMINMLLVKNGRLYDAMDNTADILVVDGIITEVSEKIPESANMRIIDAGGQIVAPGLVDMHVHLREPGFEYKEEILTGAAAAAAGGVTTCCCMPNTDPVADNAEVIQFIINKSKDAPASIIPIGAVTVGQEGVELTNFAALKAAGAIALSDDGKAVQNARIMYIAMQLARDLNMLIISHCEDADMAQNFAVNEGKASWELMLPGRPAAAEEIMVARDVILASATGARLHIAHVSTARSVEIIRKAKESGANITAETCPQYFTLTEDEVLQKEALARMNQPLRTREDVEAIIGGLVDGVIDAIATDHAPHTSEEKALPLAVAPSGIIGLETSLALALTYLYHTEKLSMERIVELMSIRPAGILGIPQPALTPGAAADIVIFDPDEEWTVKPEEFRSKARNTPFAGMKLKGRVKHTILRGKQVFPA